jgi:hypothetical protein
LLKEQQAVEIKFRQTNLRVSWVVDEIEKKARALFFQIQKLGGLRGGKGGKAERRSGGEKD